MSIKKIKEALEKNKSFLITSHIHLEGDSIGSQLALYRLLKKLGKRVFILDEDKPSRQYGFLPCIDKINTKLSRKADYDVAIVLDCPVLERAGRVAEFLDRRKTLINIDHHISNRYFGDINWVDDKASSCGEMIYELFRALKQPVEKDTALLLYVAILTDTGSFGYENTSAGTHSIVKELIESGVCPVSVHNRIYETKSFSEIKLLQQALSTLKKVQGGRITYLCITKKMLRDSGCDPVATEGFINYPRSIEGSKVALLFLEAPDEPNKIQVGFRSKGEVDVNKLASHFNGGGHHNAAGCVIKGGLKQAMNRVLKVAKTNI